MPSYVDNPFNYLLAPIDATHAHFTTIMLLFQSLPLSLILLIADAVPSSASLLPRTFQKVHGAAVGHTKSLARDLRTAFGVVLVTQSDTPNRNVVYCKSSGPGSSGLSSNGTSTSGSTSTSPSTSTSRTGTSSSSRASTSTSGSPSTTSVPSSAWKLVDSHVRSDDLVFQVQLQFDSSTTVRAKLFRWLVVLYWCRSDSWFVPCYANLSFGLFSDPEWNRNRAVCRSEHWSKLFLIPCCALLLI